MLFHQLSKVCVDWFDLVVRGVNGSKKKESIIIETVRGGERIKVRVRVSSKSS